MTSKKVKTSATSKTLKNLPKHTLKKSPKNEKVAPMVAGETEKMDTSAEVVKSKKRKLEPHGSVPSAKKIKYENKVFVAKINRRTTAETLKEVFSKFGTVVNVELPNACHAKRNKSFGFISFQDEESVSHAISESLILTVDDNPVFISNNHVRHESRYLHHKYQIQIHGVQKGGPISRDDLHSYFSKFGSIVCLKMLPFAYIAAFENQSSLVKSVEDANIQIKGVKLQVFIDQGPVKKKRKNGQKEQKVIAVDSDEDLQNIDEE